ncbi:hypothetical protein N7G274_002310 [Stereocaulon virgatum]|uniref:Uncharacterized protein n=1 Tax=Stereocaulon virgatum TaxID=373712 RepID=A0ABR4AKQ7_9LECA
MNEPVFDFSATLSATVNGPGFNSNHEDPYHMRLTLQQLPYDCPDPSFEFRDPSDVLERVFVTPYKAARSYENELRVDSEPLPNEVLHTEDVELSMTRHDFLTTEPAESEDQADKHTPPEDLGLLQGPCDNESSQSSCFNLRIEVQHAITHAWKFDTLKFSVSESQDTPRHLVGAPGEALNCEELRYLKALIFPKVQAQKEEVLADSAAAMKNLSWQTCSPANDFPSELDEATLGYLLDEFFGSGSATTLSRESSLLDKVLDDFFGAGDIATRPLESHEVDEGFFDSPDCGPSINTTWVTTPEKTYVTGGRASIDDRSFQDSGICMENAFAEASLTNSFQKSSVLVSEKKSEEPIAESSASCSAFHLNPAPPIRKRANAPRLRHFGGNCEYDWKSRREAPYDLEGFRSPSIDHNEGFGGFEPLETDDTSTLNYTVAPDACASHFSEFFALCRSPELFVLDDTTAQVIAEAQYPDFSNVTPDAASRSSAVATTQMPPMIETAELHVGVPNHWQETQQAIAANHAPRLISEAAQTDQTGFGAHDVTSSAAAATSLYHPRATSVLKHNCLLGNDSLNIEDVKGNGANTYTEEAHQSIDGSEGLDVDVSDSRAYEPSEEFASNQYLQDVSVQPISAPESNSTAITSDSSAIYSEDLALTSQAEMESNAEHAPPTVALDTASVVALKLLGETTTDPVDSALNSRGKCPITPMFSPLTPTDEDVDFVKITAQPSSSTNGLHKSSSGLTFEMSNAISAHPANANNGTHANAATPGQLTPQPKRFGGPLHQLPSFLGNPPNDSLPTPRRQQSQLSIDTATTPPIKPLPMPGQDLDQFHITTPKCIMPQTAPGTPTPAPRSTSDHQHRGVVYFRSFKNPTCAMKYGKSVQNVFSSPQLGGKGYGCAEESGVQVNKERREPSSDATVAEEDVDEAESIVPRAVNKLKTMRCQKQNNRRQTLHDQTAKISVAEAVVAPSQAIEIGEHQRGNKIPSVTPSKNKRTEEQKREVKGPAKKKARNSGTRRSTRLSTQSNEPCS